MSTTAPLRACHSFVDEHDRHRTRVPLAISSIFLRLPEVKKATGLARTTIYRLISEGVFPKPIKLAARSVAWCSAEIESWMAGRIALREG